VCVLVIFFLFNVNIILIYDAANLFNLLVHYHYFLQQCDIPEHYKEFKGAPKVDVMSFLGIKRAEPIKVQRDWD
jgi:hypothetical protein